MRLLHDNILIKLDPEKDTIGSGLLIKPQNVHEHVLRTAEVVQVGPGQWAKRAAVRIPVGVEVGDGVVFVKFVATHTETAKSIQKAVGLDHAIIKPEDVLLIYDRAEPPEINQ